MGIKKTKYTSELEKKKASEFRAEIRGYESEINYLIHTGNDSIFFDEVQINTFHLQEKYFLKAYRDNPNLDIKEFAKELIKEIGIMPLYEFMEKENKKMMDEADKEHERWIKENT